MHQQRKLHLQHVKEERMNAEQEPTLTLAFHVGLAALGYRVVRWGLEAVSEPTWYA